MTIKAVINIRAGSLAGTEKSVGSDVLLIGRDENCDIVFDDSEVSRNHAKIIKSDDSFQIEDLGSTNGTFLNGRRVKKPLKLKDKDLITISEKNVIEFSITIDEEEVGESQTGIKSREDSFIEEPSYGNLSTEEPLAEYIQPESLIQKQDNHQPFYKKLPTWAFILLIALAFLVIFCLIPLFVIEITNQWCTLFSGFFNAISPGVCP